MTSVSFTATAGQTEFQIPFPFISTGHLTVFHETLPITDLTISPEGLVVLGPSVVVLEDETITIERVTPIADLIVNFPSPSTLRASEVRTGFRQLLFISQEILARSLTGLRKTLNLQRWAGEGLPFGALGAPEFSDDAATKAYVDNLAAEGGVLPPVTSADIGKGIRVFGGGSGASYQLGAVEGASFGAKIPATTVDGGAEAVQKEGTGSSGAWLTSLTTRMPLEEENSRGEPNFGTFAIDPNGVDILVPRGSYRITAEGPVRSLTRTSDFNTTTASAALQESDGTILDIRPIIMLGRAGGGANHPASPVDPFQAQTYVKLQADVTFLGSRRLNLRLSGSTAGDDVVADTPWRINITEVV